MGQMGKAEWAVNIGSRTKREEEGGGNGLGLGQSGEGECTAFGHHHQQLAAGKSRTYS